MSIALIVPGLHSSGPDHWQSWFESRLVPSRRVVQRDWRKPNLADWSQRVRQEIRRVSSPVYIVAHSFGALAAAQAAHKDRPRIAGAMFVAPADPEKFGFADLLPTQPLGFPSVVVASANDPWMPIDHATLWAGLWGSDFVNLGAAGHINAESGYGPWPEGLEIFARLRGLAQPDVSLARDRHGPLPRRSEQIRRMPASAPSRLLSVAITTRLEAAS
jgi:predicted alpha/beta hydrolase family esterase